jgi:hypothetical protein
VSAGPRLVAAGHPRLPGPPATKLQSRCMAESTKPAPPWRVRLRGEEADLNDVANCLQGRTRIICEQGVYFLESEILDNLATLDEVFRESRDLLKTISGLTRVRRSIAKPIEATGVCWKDSSGGRGWILTASEEIIVYSGVVRLAGPGVFGHCVEVALRDDMVRSNLDDFLGEWDFPRLRRIGESLLLELGAGDIRRGLREVISRQWASDDDCATFWDSVNYGDRKSPGAHSQLRRAANQNPMNRIVAGEFLRGLLAKWIESKI